MKTTIALGLTAVISLFAVDQPADLTFPIEAACDAACNLGRFAADVGQAIVDPEFWTNVICALRYTP